VLRTDHVSSISSARSSTAIVAPCARSSSAWPVRPTPTTKPKPPARPASRRQRVLEDRRRQRLDAHRARRGQERVGRWLAAQVLAVGDHAVDDLLEELPYPRRAQHFAGVGG
jgi:hypothetical protein